MKVFICKTTALGAEKLWDASVGRNMMIHYTGKIVPKDMDLDPILYIYEVTMDEEEALLVTLAHEGVRLVAV